MKRLLIVVIIVVLARPSIVLAKEQEPIDLPKWATQECINNISVIDQHEVGSTNSVSIYRFIVSQIILDAKAMGCDKLTLWRWRILSNPEPSKNVINTVLAWDISYPKCKFVGNMRDVNIWRSYGYRARVDYIFKSKNFTVVGADCEIGP